VARLLGFVVLLGVIGLSVSAAPDEPSPPAKKKNGPAADIAEVRFVDGSNVRMNLAQPAIEITTRYGKLKIPVADIRRIEFAFRYPDRAEAKIDAAITRLTDADPKVRLAAESELREFRELAYPMLKRAAAGTSSIDRSLQATLLVKWLEEKVGPEKLKIRDQDVIQAAEFTVAGKIEAPSVKGCTPYFGDVTVQVAEVRSIRFLAGPGAETELTIDAARYAAMAQDVWLDTEVDLAEGAAIEISAAGQVDLWPQGGNYKVGPDAQPRQGNSPDGNPAGILLGRIGERGKAFHIGSKFRGSLSESGRLYLRIACSPWNNASTGGYAVKIDPNADLDETPAVVAPAPKKKNKALPKGQFK